MITSGLVDGGEAYTICFISRDESIRRCVRMPTVLGETPPLRIRHMMKRRLIWWIRKQTGTQP